MSKSHKSTQTDHLLVFCVHKPQSKENQSLLQQRMHRSLIKINKKIMDVEDIIIDQIASDHILYAKGTVKNTALRNPLKWKPRFSSLGSRLLISFESDLERLRQLLLLPDDGSLVDRFEKTLCDVVRNHHRFLNQFNKYVYQPGRTVMHGLAIFVFFFARCFKSKLVAFAMEFLLVVLHQVYLVAGQNNSSIVKCLIEQLENCDSLALKAKEQYIRMLGDSKELKMPPVLLSRLFLDYLVSNDFLVPTDYTVSLIS